MAASKVKTSRLVKLYRKLGSVNAILPLTTLSYMSIRVRLIHAGVIKGKTFTDYRNGK
jgi:hypothetical protein